MTTIIDYQVLIFTFMQKAGEALQYELTCGILLLALWFMGHFAGNQKAKKNKPTCSPLVSKRIPNVDVKNARCRAPESSSGKPEDIDINPAKLCDPAWLVPQVINLCPAQVQQALILYRSALKAGMRLQDLPAQTRRKLHDKLVSSALSTGRTEDAMQLLRDLMRGSARAGDVDAAMKVYEQMLTVYDLLPDFITFSLLIKANCDANRLDESLKLLESMLQLQLKPDEVILNYLLSGCERDGNLELGKLLFSDLVASGVRPSNATFSLLLRLYHQRKLLGEALEFLRTEPSKCNVDPEPRLYFQLIHACIRERQGRRAVQAYEMMLECCSAAISAPSNAVGLCVKLNMFETAAEILAVAAEKGARADKADAFALLQAVLSKKKSVIARDVANAMHKLGFALDRGLAAAVAAPLTTNAQL